MINKKFFVCLFFFVYSVASFFAVELPLFQGSLRVLEDAQYAYDSRSYGTALKLAEDAKLLRSQEVADYLGILDRALSPIEVRDAGDAISSVISVLKFREVYDAIDLIQYVVELKGVEYFNNSVSKVREYIASKEIIPEAAYLIAKVYQIEGEYDLSVQYYTYAWENSAVLEIPDSKYDILYDLAELSYSFNKLEEAEKALLLIVADDPYYTNKNFVAAVYSSIKRGYGVDKVFDLYRTDCYRSTSAFFKLADLYQEQGRLEEAFESDLFGILTAFTRINEVLSDRSVVFKYTGLKDLLETAMKNREISDWTVDIGFWHSLYMLGELADTIYPENKDFGETIFESLSVAPESYWVELADIRLKK